MTKRNPKMETIIYTLSNPLTNQVFYVGATTMSLERRVNAGYGAPTVISLRELGMSPVIEALDTCLLEDRPDLESYWVCQFKAWGFAVENKVYNNATHLGRKREKPNGARLVSKERVTLCLQMSSIVNLILEEDRKAANDKYGASVIAGTMGGSFDDINEGKNIISFFKRRISGRIRSYKQQSINAA